MRLAFRPVCAGVLCTVALVVPPIAPTGVATAADDVLAKFRQEYRAAAARLEDASKNIRCRLDYEFSGLNGNTRIEKTIIYREGIEKSTLYKNRKILVVNHNTMIRGKKYNDAYVFCVTPTYTFQLHSQYSGDKPGPYVLRAVSAAGQTSPNFIEGVYINSVYTTNQTYALDKDRIADLLWDERCKVTRAEWLPAPSGEGDESRKIEVHFDNKAGNHWIGGGRLIFDPSLDWALTEYDVDINSDAPGMKTMPNGSKKVGKLVNRMWPGVGIFPVRLEYAFRYPHGDDKRVANVVSVAHDDGDDTPFTLAAYGLPDIYVKERPRDYTMVMMLSLGAALFLVSLLFKRVSARKA